jgi:hypothetical protein
MNKSLLIGAAFAFGLTACATMGTQGLDGGDGRPIAPTTLDLLCASDKVRCIQVFVDAGVGRITSVKDEDFNGPNHLIIWTINSTNPSTVYTFTDDGIKLKSTSLAPPANEFNCRPMSGKKIFLCSNRNTVPRAYTYDVRLKDNSGTPLPVFDPKITNF